MQSKLRASVSVLAIATGAALWAGQAMAESAPEASGAVEEVIVTAQRRSENIQNVPISINAFTGDMLQQMGVSSPADLTQVTPGLSAHGSIGDDNPIFTIRGIGLNDTFSNNNSPVGLYIDDVLVPFNPMMSFQLFDLDRVEVLKGPQGTLYGRNTTGGAINFITRKPSEDFGGYARVDYGSFGRFSYEGAVGGPITSTLSGRLSISGVDQTGGWQHVTNQNNRENGQGYNTAIRGQLEWRPNEKFDANLALMGFNEDQQIQLRQHIGFKDPVTGAVCAQVLAGIISPACVDNLGYSHSGNPRNVEESALYGNRSRADSIGGRLTANYHFDRATLTSVTGATSYHRALGDDSDASPFIQLDSLFHDNIYSLTQELRLASDNSWGFNWVVGAYASADRIRGDILQAEDQLLGTRTDVNFTQKTTTGAVFGDVSYPITSKLSLDGGLRYTYERKTFNYAAYDLNPFGTSPFGGGLQTSADEAINTGRLTGKASLNYKPTDGVLLYASYSRGFKSGGFDGAIAFNPSQLLPYRPETINAYEVGAKTTLLDHKLILNGAGYFYDWRDFQAFAVQIRSGVPVDVLTNAGNAQVYGIEGDATWRPIPSLETNVGFNWMHTEITSFNAAAGQVNDLGKRLANAPNFSMFARARYDFEQSFSGFTPFVEVDGSLQSRVFYEITNQPVYSQSAYALLNAQIGVTAVNGVEVMVYGHNLTQKTYMSEAFDGGFALFPSEYYLGDPRTFGVSLRYKF